MIFVTVGTHEQPFDRLVEAADTLLAPREQVFIQTGFSKYRPRIAEYENMLRYQEMLAKIEEADVIISHGGPGCIMMALEANKLPVVAPRTSHLNEHVNDHQVYFASRLAAEHLCLLVEDVSELPGAVELARSSEVNVADKIQRNCARFVENLRSSVLSLV